MGIRFRDRIAYKQARSVLLISLVLGLLSTSWQIWLDLGEERQRSVAEIERIVSLHKDTAQRAIYNLNLMQAEEITRTLISHPAIFHAQLVDDFGDTLAESLREPLPAEGVFSGIGGYFFEVNTHINTRLWVPSSNNGSGNLVIDLDAAYIASNFARRAITGLMLGLLHNVVLAGIFLLLFYRYLSKPVLNIVEWVNGLRHTTDSSKLPYAEDDEIGDLVRSFSGLWHDRQLMTNRLSNTVQELSKSEHFSRSLMENAGDAMFLCRPDSTIVRVNNQAIETLARAREFLLGEGLAAFSQNYSRSDFQSMFSELDEKQPLTFEDIQLRSDGKHFPVEARAIRLNLNDQSYILIQARDISVRKEAEQKIYELAFFDTLTGLANRRLFLDRLTSSLELHHVNYRCGAVLFMDLDRFKTINDSLGHGVGDRLLCGIADRLKAILPVEATCARFGGDEFVILLPEAGRSADACAEVAAQIAQQILDQMTTPFEIDEHLLYSSTSIGISVFPAGDSTAMDVLRHADTALYRVKALGRNGFQFYDPEMQSSAQERLQIEKGLHQALEQGELELWFQPQVDGQSRIIGAEALLRWQHPVKGMVPPAEFIQIAEESGQIIEIGYWVLSRALGQLAAWRKQGLPEHFRRLAINISPMQFMQVDFVERLFRLLDDLDLPGLMVELEITENMLLNNFEVASSKMKLLRQRGISFAIDDFGTGYSSLKYLRYLPLDILKIDRSFVSNLSPSSEAAAIVEAIIATADRLDLAVIAEGVETYSERDTLTELGCHCFQGYLFSKPVPAGTFYNLLEGEWAIVSD
ncbi:putative bifunctional diguanylate cyclase/phosphodiesterase [Marinobacterium jannaschii]|uniref:putative bifunctional diguanylate cyclase/phosphodiesterase n=1 Tax=Marinobacterium jannaschii TaxID=64970 RepID=UPI000568C36E|nr:GGDEF and EAL domain-containing protein [Marinobacterium jannaschii]